MWPLHQMSQPLPGQVHISAPLSGGPPRLDAAAHVTRYLEQLWVHNPVATNIHVTSVAITIVADRSPDAPAPHRLIAMLTFDESAGDPDGRRLDGMHMARHLQNALRQLG